MRRDPLAAVNLATTSQTKPIPGVSQVRNAAGGYVFAKDLWNQLEDFLILGTTGGTYYTDADVLTQANVDMLFDAIAADGPRVVTAIRSLSRSPRVRRSRVRTCSRSPLALPTAMRRRARLSRQRSLTSCGRRTTWLHSSATGRTWQESRRRVVPLL